MCAALVSTLVTAAFLVDAANHSNLLAERLVCLCRHCGPSSQLQPVSTWPGRAAQGGYSSRHRNGRSVGPASRVCGARARRRSELAKLGYCAPDIGTDRNVVDGEREQGRKTNDMSSSHKLSRLIFRCSLSSTRRMMLMLTLMLLNATSELAMPKALDERTSSGCEKQ